MKFFTFLAFLCLPLSFVVSQGNCTEFILLPNINGGFENYDANCVPAKAFNYDCVDNWFAALADPLLVENSSSVAINYLGSSFEGDNYAAIRHQWDKGHGVPGGRVYYSGAIGLTLSNLTPGNVYEINFRTRIGDYRTPTNPNGADVLVHYTKDVVNANATGSPIDLITNLSLDPNTITNTIANVTGANSWVQRTITFTAIAGFDQLVFIAESNAATKQRFSSVLIDDVEVSECDPCSGVNVSGAFTPSISSANLSTYTYQPVVTNTYPGLNADSEWIVLSSSNNSPNGPFTLVGTYADHTSFPPFQYGTLYTVIHRLNTDCGEACYIRNVCESCFRNGGKVSGEAIDCSIVDEIIDDVTPDCPQVAPTGLVCYGGRGGTELEWDPVPGATQYQVQFLSVSGNTGFCCSAAQCPVTTPAQIVTTNFIVAPSDLPACYRWRVRTFCGNKQPGPWSVIRDQNNFACRERETEGCPWCPWIGGFRAVQIYPNPSSNEFTIDFRQFSESEVNIEIFDATGKMVHSNSTQQIDKYTWTPALTNQNGIYLIRIKDGSETSMHKVVLQR